MFNKFLYWITYAQENTAPHRARVGVRIPGCPYGENLNLTQWIECLYRFAMQVAIGLAIIVIIYGGYRYIASQGNPDEVTAAKNTITGAIIGIIILILARLILGTISPTLVGG